MSDVTDNVLQPLDDIYTIKAHYKCPSCGVDMQIAARYDKSDRTVEGVSKVMQHQCHSCNKVITPVIKNV